MSHPSCLIWDVRGAVCSTPSIGCSPSPVLLSGAFAGAAPSGASGATFGGASGGAPGVAPGFLMIWDQN